MSAVSEINLSATATWQDITQTYAVAANAEVLIQNQGPQPMRVAFGGTGAPATTNAGVLLRAYDSTSGNAGHVWVWSAGGTTFAVTVGTDSGGGGLTVGGSAVSASNPLPVQVVSGGGGGGGASLADLSGVDAAGNYWIVRDTGSLPLTYISWSTGQAGTPVGTVMPASKLTGEQFRGTQYHATAGGGGYAAGDVLEHIVALNIATTPPQVLGAAWVNLTQATVLSSAPVTTAIAEITANTAISAGAGTIADLVTIKAAYGTLNTAAPSCGEVIGVTDGSGKLQALGGAIFHNGDNQALGTAQVGLITGGITQVLNAAGNLDRVREGYGDAMAVTGLAGEVGMLFNGTTYDRPRSASAAQATTGTGVAAQAAFGVYAASALALSAGQYSAMQLDAAGNHKVTDQSYATHASAFYAGTVTATAQSLASVIGTVLPAWAMGVRITPLVPAGTTPGYTPAVQYRCDGTAPTAAAGGGCPIYFAQAFTVAGAPSLAGMQLISGTGSSLTVSIELIG